MSTSVPSSINYTTNNPNLSRAYALKSESEARALYNEWASTYDKDLQAEDYNSPTAAVDAIAAHLGAGGDQQLDILDAGCGTGLVGLAIQAHPALRGKVTALDGLDLSEGMLEVARRTGVYRDLRVADLGKPVEIEEGRYAVVACVGTLTQGHVGPKPVLAEFVRVAKKDGLVVATVLNDIWTTGGFESEVERLKNDGAVQVLGTDEFGVRKGEQKGARMLVMRKL